MLLASSMNGSLAAFTASITNTAGSGTVIMQEANGGIICNSTDATGGVSSNSATCATINKYGGNLAMVPNQTVTTSITIKNTGTAPAATFTLNPGVCAQATNGSVNGTALDFCTKVNVKITVGGATPAVYTGTAAALTAPIALAAPVAPGATVAIQLRRHAGHQRRQHLPGPQGLAAADLDLLHLIGAPSCRTSWPLP